jgi:hypothetical protein
MRRRQTGAAPPSVEAAAEDSLVLLAINALGPRTRGAERHTLGRRLAILGHGLSFLQEMPLHCGDLIIEVIAVFANYICDISYRSPNIG